jgi:hypothetical protein
MAVVKDRVEHYEAQLREYQNRDIGNAHDEQKISELTLCLEEEFRRRKEYQV